MTRPHPRRTKSLNHAVMVWYALGSEKDALSQLPGVTHASIATVTMETRVSIHNRRISFKRMSRI
jgi:hypothetical protein